MASSKQLSTTLWTVLFLPTFLINAELLTYSTNEIWSPFRRPSWSNNITIIYDESQIYTVAGIVIPISTSGRPSAPNPYNGYVTGTSVGLDKGHLMALSNGGCDVKLNIVPQSAMWQRTGGWRKLEIEMFDYASKKYGWDEDSPYHISDIEAIADVGSVNYVFYNVSMTGYDTDTGEPIKYKGYVKSSSERYSFTIEPTQNAIWSDGIAPPQNATHVQVTFNTTATTVYNCNTTINNVKRTECDCGANSSEPNNKQSGGAVPMILVIIGLFITNVVFIVLWIRERKTVKNIYDNSYNYLGHGL